MGKKTDVFQPSTLLMALGVAILAIFGCRYLRALSQYRVEVIPKVIRAGEVAEGSVHRIKFEILNKDRKPLSIANVGSSCGCTKIELSSNTIQPESSISVSLSLDTAGRFGHAQLPVYVLFKNYPLRPLIVPIDIDVKQYISNNPYRLEIDLGPKDHAKKVPVQMERLDGKPLKISGVVSPKGVNVSYRRGEKPTIIQLSVTFTSTIPAGRHVDNLYVHIKDLPRSRIPLKYSRSGRFYFDPEVCSLGILDAGETRPFKIIVRGPDIRRAAIGSVPSGVTCELRIRSRGEAIIQGVYTADTRSASLVDERIMLRTGDAGEPYAELPMFAAVKTNKGVKVR
ncbi:MAG: DUF1573 domain-containing protein [Bacillota bacterium]